MTVDGLILHVKVNVLFEEPPCNQDDERVDATTLENINFTHNILSVVTELSGIQSGIFESEAPT